MLGRDGIEVVEKASEDLELPLLAAPTAGGCDLGEAAVDVDHLRRVTMPARGEALRGETEVAGLLVELDDLIFRNLICGGDRVDKEPLAEADLDRFEEGRQPALDEVGDRAELVGRACPVDLGKDGDQLVALGRRLHPVEVCGELGKVHLQGQFSGTSRMSGRIDMTGTDLLVDAFVRIPEQVHSVLDGLTPDQLTFRVDSEANTIAWLIWHLSRIEDDHIAGVAGRPQVWTSDGWARRWRRGSRPASRSPPRRSPARASRPCSRR